MIFHVRLEHAEDGWIVAECPAFPGWVSQGKDASRRRWRISRGDNGLALGRGPKGRFDERREPVSQ